MANRNLWEGARQSTNQDEDWRNRCDKIKSIIRLACVKIHVSDISMLEEMKLGFDEKCSISTICIVIYVPCRVQIFLNSI